MLWATVCSISLTCLAHDWQMAFMLKGQVTIIPKCTKPIEVKLWLILNHFGVSANLERSLTSRLLIISSLVFSLSSFVPSKSMSSHFRTWQLHIHKHPIATLRDEPTSLEVSYTIKDWWGYSPRGVNIEYTWFPLRRLLPLYILMSNQIWILHVKCSIGSTLLVVCQCRIKCIQLSHTKSPWG